MDNETNEIPIPVITEKDFEKEVLRVKLPVLVAFGALWSRPCNLVLPILNEVTAACCGRVKIVAVNVDDNPDLGLWYGIRSIPTLAFFLNGKVRDKIVGTATKEAILCKLHSVFEGGESAPLPPEANPEI